MDVRVTRARRVFADGKHNAFTGIATAHGKVFITFRSAENHKMDEPHANDAVFARDDAHAEHSTPADIFLAEISYT